MWRFMSHIILPLLHLITRPYHLPTGKPHTWICVRAHRILCYSNHCFHTAWLILILMQDETWGTCDETCRLCTLSLSKFGSLSITLIQFDSFDHIWIFSPYIFVKFNPCMNFSHSLKLYVYVHTTYTFTSPIANSLVKFLNITSC